MRRTLCLFAIAGTLLGSRHSLAQEAISVPGGLTSCRMVGSQLEVRNITDDSVIIARQGVNVAHDFPVGVNTTVATEAHAYGVDVILTVRNVTSQVKRLGYFRFGVINLGEEIEYFDFRHTSAPVRTRASQHIAWGSDYPNDLYSPVAVLRNQRYAVGISLQYPVMDYRHDVSVSIGSPGSWMADGEAGRGWVVDFRLSNLGNEAAHAVLRNPAQLAPGEERVYRASLRVTTNPQQWQETLLPYRDYFRSMYGPVSYVRNDTPVLGFGLGDTTLATPANPMGYHTHLRPDVNGFANTSAYLRSLNRWNTVLIMAPTGVYRTNRERNWPFQFTSQWESSPQLRTAFSPTVGLPTVHNAGIDLALWWGRANEVATTWDTPDWEPFDPENPQHRQLALRELDGAARAGATVIGLDTYVHRYTPIWKSRQWMRDMKALYPQMSFVTEPTMCDIMHIEAATLVSAWHGAPSNPSSPSQCLNLPGPNTLADFLLPGHETWAAYRYVEHNRVFGQPSESRVLEDLRRIASYGYRPCMLWTIPDPGPITAAKSWETSLPPSIRDNDPWIADIRAGRRPGQPAPAPQQTPPPAGNPPPPSGGSGTSGGGDLAHAGGSGSSATSGSSGSSGGNTGSGSTTSAGGSGAGGSSTAGSGAGNSGAGGSGIAGSGAGNSGAGGSGIAGSGAGGSGSPAPTPSPQPSPSPAPPPIIVVTQPPAGTSSSAGSGGDSGGSANQSSGSQSGPFQRGSRTRGAVDLRRLPGTTGAPANAPRVMRWQPTPNVTRVVVLMPPQTSPPAAESSGTLESDLSRQPSRRRSGAAGLRNSGQRQASEQGGG